MLDGLLSEHFRIPVRQQEYLIRSSIARTKIYNIIRSVLPGARDGETALARAPTAWNVFLGIQYRGSCMSPLSALSLHSISNPHITHQHNSTSIEGATPLARLGRERALGGRGVSSLRRLGTERARAEETDEAKL